MTPKLSPAARAALVNLSYSWRHYREEQASTPTPSALVRDLLPAALLETPLSEEAKEVREDETMYIL